MIYLKAATGLPTAYAIGQMLLKADDKLFERYERGENAPTITTVILADKRIAGSMNAYAISPCLPGTVPRLSLWKSLADDPRELWDQLVSSNYELAEMQAEGSSIESKLEAVAGKFLWQRSDMNPFDDTPNLSTRLSELLRLPGDRQFFEHLFVDPSEYRFLLADSNQVDLYVKLIGAFDDNNAEKTHVATHVANELADLLLIPAAERSAFIAKTCALEAAVLAEWSLELIAHMAEPDQFDIGYDKRQNFLLRRLEEWRLSQLSAKGLDMDMLAAMTTLWRYCHATGDGTLECSYIYTQLSKYVTPRLLAPFEIVIDFRKFIGAMEDEIEARICRRLDSIPSSPSKRRVDPADEVRRQECIEQLMNRKD